MAVKIYNVVQAAELLSVSKHTIINYIKGGQLKASKVGRDYKIFESDIVDFVRRGTEPNYLDKIKK